jgi:hypothetical protein
MTVLVGKKEKKKREKGRVESGVGRGKKAACMGGGENEGVRERDSADRGGGRGVAREEGEKYRSGGREMGGKGRKKGGAGQLLATRQPPISNVPCKDTSPFGDMWHFAMLAYADVALCHVTKL